MRTIFSLIVTLLALSGCGAESTVYADRGTVCLYSEGPQGDGADGLHHYEPGFALRAEARSPGCFQSGCFSVNDAECHVEVDGDEVLLETLFSIETPYRLQCKSDCRQAEASGISAAPLDAGTYTVTLGASTAILEVPSKQKLVCLDVP